MFVPYTSGVDVAVGIFGGEAVSVPKDCGWSDIQQWLFSASLKNRRARECELL